MDCKISSAVFSEMFKCIGAISTDYMHIIAEKGCIKILIHNDIHVLHLNYEASIHQEGSTCIMHANFIDAVKSISGHDISIVSNEQETQFTSGTLCLKMPVVKQPPQDYAFPNIDAFNIDLEKLKQALDVVWPASLLHDYVETFASCIYFDSDSQSIDDNTYVVATDAHRLGIAPLHNVKFSKGFLLSKKSIVAIKKLIGHCESAKCAVYEGGFYFFAEHFSLMVSIIDREYPDYKKIVPVYTNSFAIDGQCLYSKIVAIANILDKLQDPVEISINHTNKQLNLLCKSHKGSVTDSVEYISLNDTDLPDISISLSAKYLIDTLSVLHGEITVFFDNNHSPVLFKDNNGSEYVIMPKISNA